MGKYLHVHHLFAKNHGEILEIGIAVLNRLNKVCLMYNLPPKLLLQSLILTLMIEWMRRLQGLRVINLHTYIQTSQQLQELNKWTYLVHAGSPLNVTFFKYG